MLRQQHLFNAGCSYLRRCLASSTKVVLEPAPVVNTAPTTSVDQREVDHFAGLAGEWLDENGPMKILHAFNRVRVPWIIDELTRNRKDKLDKKEPLRGLKLLDVGSGCGILTFPLARLGAQVDGLEPSESCVNAGNAIKERVLSEKACERVKFVPNTVESHSIDHTDHYDAIVVSEVVEHVADVQFFMKACYHMAKPGATLFFTTLNRTILSRFIAVEAAEALGFVPKGTHDWGKFLTPSELKSLLCDHRFRVAYSRGLLYDPILNEWDWFFSDQINYAVLAKKT